MPYILKSPKGIQPSYWTIGVSRCSATSPISSDWNTRISGGVSLRNIALAALAKLRNVRSGFEREAEKEEEVAGA